MSIVLYFLVPFPTSTSYTEDYRLKPQQAPSEFHHEDDDLGRSHHQCGSEADLPTDHGLIDSSTDMPADYGLIDFSTEVAPELPVADSVRLSRGRWS